MSKKEYPTSVKEWLKYLTIDNYYTFFQIENRKNIIEKSGCDYIEVKAKILEFRAKNRTVLFEFEEKRFYICDTYKLRNNIEEIKKFWQNIEYRFQSKFSFELLKETLIEEGYYSSTIEGAHSTIKRAKTLASGKSKPKNRSEFMVLNNFRALNEIEELNNELSHEIIYKIHKITVENTLDDDYNIGCYRDEANEIINASGKVIFSPISDIKKMHKMLDELLKFLQDDEFSKPVEPLYKAMAFHFLFAFIHPFDDGNGRTVRILFTYILKHYGFDMFYYISLSEIIYKKKAKDYYEAFINVERSDKNSQKEFDMSFFFYYMSDVMLQGLKLLKHRINTHLREDIIKNVADDLDLDLTPRQRRVIKILSNKDNSFMLTVDDLAKKCGVTTRTLQKDLKLLVDFNLLDRKRAPSSRKYYYRLKVEL
ncbi:conserved hypothetical protein [hydrothermal vent metagenome]|uniref:Fido domain-containing protein n=1 Tax=hydrothermal vent metagenome TaxID=652676 RepID=A0A1W1CS67_9ZZZZ